MKTTKKEIKRFCVYGIWMFLFLLPDWLNSAPPVTTGNDLGGGEEVRTQIAPALRRIIQAQNPIRTFSFEYTVSEMDKESNKWKGIERCRLKFDKQENRLYWSRQEFSPESSRELDTVVFQENTLIKIKETKGRDGEMLYSTANINKGEKWNDRMEAHSFFLEKIFYYNQAMPENNFYGSAALLKGFEENSKFIHYSLQKVGNSMAVCVSPKPKGEIDPSLVYEIFKFDIKTGNLLERERVILEKTKDGVKERREPSASFSDYFYCNGVPFPGVLIFTLSGGQSFKIEIDKKTARIEDILDKHTFVPSFPPKTIVHDKIKGIQYETPAIGNAAAEDAVVKELDALFEKGNK